MKKLLSVCLCLFILFSTSVWTFAYSGEGTVTNPYKIYTYADLKGIVNNLSASYILMSDLNLSSVDDYEPIGQTVTGPFAGIFDGNGHTIRNLTIENANSKYTGLFGLIDGTVKNLTLENVDITGGRYIGSVAGYALENSEINNCVASGTISQEYMMSFSFSGYVGGIVGEAHCEIRNCTNRCNTDGCGCGGIVGFTDHSIFNCYNYGDDYGAGVVYDCDCDATDIVIEHCRNFGNVGSGICGSGNAVIQYCSNSGDFSSVGIGNGSEIKYCYNEGNSFLENGSFETRYQSGIGYAKTIEQCYNSGMVPNGISNYFYGSSDRNITVRNCYNIGETDVCFGRSSIVSQCYNSGKSYYSSLENCTGWLGGYIETENKGSVQCYYTQPFDQGCEGFNITSFLTPEESVSSCSYEGFDFNDIWYIDSELNSGYPMLQCFQDEQYVMNVSNANLAVGETLQLYPFCSNVSLENVSWKSSNSQIVSVSSSGLITCHSRGVAEITALTTDGHRINTWVSVLDSSNGISLDQHEITVQRGEIIPVSWSYQNEDSDEMVILKWGNETGSTCCLNDARVLTPYSYSVLSSYECDYIIYAPSERGEYLLNAVTSLGYSDVCIVHVVDNISSFSLCDLTIHRGLTDKIESDCDSIIHWTVEDESIVSIDANGNVTGLSIGSTMITGITDNGLSAACIVTVDAPLERIDLQSNQITVVQGEEGFINTDIYPSDTTSNVWYNIYSGDYSGLDFNSNVGHFTAVYSGDYIVSIESDNGLVAYCNVRVLPKADWFELTDQTIHRGDTRKALVTLYPDEAVNEIVSWYSSDDTVATVDSNGNITGVSAGTTVITAQLDNGLEASCAITVDVPVEQILLETSSIILLATESSTIGATMIPSDATESLTYELFRGSYDDVSLDGETGEITANRGSTVIVAVRSTSGVTAYCTVYVKKADMVFVRSCPEKTVYDIGDELDLNGLEVAAIYNNGEIATVSDFSVNGFDSTASGEQSVEIVYYDPLSGETLNTSFDVAISDNTNEYIQTLAEAKSNAKAEIDQLVPANASDAVMRAANNAKAAIDRATTLSTVENAKRNGIEAIQDLISSESKDYHGGKTITLGELIRIIMNWFITLLKRLFRVLPD